MSDKKINSHFNQRRKEIEMYQAGVAAGIRFVIDRFLAKFDERIKDEVIDLLLNEYNYE